VVGFSLRLDVNRVLKATAFGLPAVLAVFWATFDMSRRDATSRLFECESRGRAGAECHAIAAAEARALSACEGHGRGGRICYAAQE
jgi:hypothetical protein